MEKAKLYKIGNIVLSGGIILACIFYLKSAVASRSLEVTIGELMNLFLNGFELLSIVVLLMPLNWSLEAFKWKQILDGKIAMTFGESLRSVLSGVTFAIITPNGIGEYGGRLLSISRENRAKALFLNSFLSLSQLLITTIGGLVGYLIVQEYFSFLIHYSIVILLVIALLVSYFFTQINFNLFSKLTGTKRNTLKWSIPKKQRVNTLVLSFLRYSVFCLQFALLLHICEVELSAIHYFGLISTIYLVAAIIPTGWFSNLLVRGSISYYFFEQMGDFGEQAVIASSLLWIINLFIPALAGLVVVRNVDWLKLFKLKTI